MSEAVAERASTAALKPVWLARKLTQNAILEELLVALGGHSQSSP